MPCAIKDELIREYQLKVSRFTLAIADLRITKGTTSKEEYHRLFQVSEDARAHAEDVRIDLMQHIAEHGC